MTRDEFAEALLAGKELTSTAFATGGTSYTLQLREKHLHIIAKSAAHSELDYAVAFANFRAMDLPANPHPEGSFLWAGFEYSRGRIGARGSPKSTAYRHRPANAPWEQRMFLGEDFFATDWRIVEEKH